MSLKRSASGGKSSFGGGSDAGAKVDRQELFDELKRLAGTNDAFTPVDVALAIGAGEPGVSKALLGLAVEGYLEKADVGRYRAGPMAEMTQAEFLKAFSRAAKVDSTRQRDLSEISRLKQNNDTMRQRLLAAIAEKEHYLGVLKKHGIDPGPAPTPVPAAAAPSAPTATPAATTPPSVAGEAAPGPQGLAVPSPESDRLPSGPGDTGAASPDAGLGVAPDSDHGR
ncbi:MAG TPA: hypothetical protein VFH73_07135 [Polyangia bacterium]|jgi:hypothetical protein|nr:hypothetical protein [Polyangia bacterium]